MRTITIIRRTRRMRITKITITIKAVIISSYFRESWKDEWRYGKEEHNSLKRVSL